MSRIQFLSGLLALAMAVGCKAQPTPQGSQELTLNHRIEIMVRAQYNIPLEYVITQGTRKPSQIPGYDSLPITLSHGTSQSVVDFLISTDNNTLARLDTYDLKDYPLFKVAGRPIRGNPAASVTVISYDDLECPYCGQMHRTLFPATLNRYKDKVRFIYKDFPLVEIHPWAMHAAVDANCLGAQNDDAYWAFSDYVHAHGQEINGQNHDSAKSFEALDLLARQQGTSAKLDSAKLDACITNQDESQVRASAKEAESLGVEGAPALFVDGARVGGAIPEAQLWRMLDHALEAVGVALPAAPATTPSATPASAKPFGTAN